MGPENYTSFPRRKSIYQFACFLIVLLALMPRVQAAKVTLAWDANVPTPDGYRVFQRTCGQAYNYRQWVYQGTGAACTVENLAPDTAYFFVVRAYIGQKMSADSNEISYTTAAAASDTDYDGISGDCDLFPNASIGGNPSMIIDDGDMDTSSTGAWRISAGRDPFGTQSLYSKDVGADYAYESYLTGRYEVSIWWSGYKSRCSSVPVEIYDGDMLLDTRYVDQRQNSGQWNVLGIYDFSGAANISIVSASTDCSTAADALRFIAAAKTRVIDDGDAGTSAVGDWSVSGGRDPFGTQSLYSREVGAAYTYESPLNGRYEVSIWWSGYKSRCSSVPVEIYDGAMLLDTRYVDQRQNSGRWNMLGVYDFKDMARVSVLAESSACSIAADALKYSEYSTDR